MDRVNGNNTVDIGDGRRGFRSQNAAAGIAGTEVTDKILNDVQEEICAVIENAGLELDPGNQQQLWEALQGIAAPGFANRAAWLPVLSITTTAPPNNASLGDAYIIPAGATGAWAGNQQNLAEWTGSKWRIANTKNGHGVSLPDGRVFVKVGSIYIEKIALDVQSGKWNFAVAGGSANALIVSFAPAITAYVAGFLVRIKITDDNTGMATLNVNGLGAKAIIRASGDSLQPADLMAGQIVDLVYDGTAFQAVSLSKATQNGRLLGVKVYDTPGVYTYTPSPGTLFIDVQVQGAGGGGGGAAAVSTTNYVSCGGGGGGGGYTASLIPIPADPVTITVGAGGIANLGNAGHNGGASSFGSILSASGGEGALRYGPTGFPLYGSGGAGGTASGGQVKSNGGVGNTHVVYSAGSGFDGHGAMSFFGGGGRRGGTNTNGASAITPGGGGGGAVAVNGYPAQSGGAGGNGIVIIKEYAL